MNEASGGQQTKATVHPKQYKKTAGTVYMAVLVGFFVRGEWWGNAAESS